MYIAIVINQIVVFNFVLQGKELKEGDTIGLGMIQNEDEFLVFITQNGEWVDSFSILKHEWSYSDDIHVNDSPLYTDTFKLILLTSAVHRNEQMRVKVNDGKIREFKFKLEFEKEECSICLDEVLKPLIIELDGCKHRFCKKCIKGYLENSLNEGNVIDNKCPDVNCDKIICDLDILKVLSALQFGKFKQYRVLSKLRMDPNSRWCPNPDCTQPGTVADPNHPDFPKLHCESCNTDFCFHCSDIWHEDLTCKQWSRTKARNVKNSEVRRKKKEESNTKAWLKANKTVKCKKCGSLVQKAEGCNHMTCRCGHEFCWLCGETIMSAIGSSYYPLHYTTGPCAGLQMSNVDELSTTRRIIRGVTAPARYGVIIAGLPIYGAAKLLFN